MRTIIIVLLMLLSGCSALQIDSNPVQKPALAIPAPDPLQLDDITFITITKANAIEVLDDLEKRGLKPVVIGMAGKDYKILAVNMSKIKEHIILLNDIIKKYKEYYEGK